VAVTAVVHKDLQFSLPVENSLRIQQRHDRARPAIFRALQSVQFPTSSMRRTCPLLRQVTLCTSIRRRHLVIHTSNIQSREAELNHVAEWAQRNNLKLYRAKSVEIVFMGRKHKQLVPDAPSLPDTQRVTHIRFSESL